MSTRKKVKRNPQHFTPRDLNQYVIEESEKTGKSKDEILQDTFKDGYVVISESGDGAFKVEGGQLFKPLGEKIDDLTECRRLRERFGPIASCVEYTIDNILGSGIDVVLDDITDPHQKEVKQELQRWINDVYQDAYTIGLNSLLHILVDNCLTDGFAAAEIVYEGQGDINLFNKYAKLVSSSVISQESGKLAKSDYSSYEIKDPVWSELQGIARLKIFLDAPTRLRLYRRGLTWEADYWVLDAPNVAQSQGGMTSAAQKNLQQGVPMQITSDELIKSTMPNSRSTTALPKPSAYFLPWQIFSLSLTRRTWLEKGPSIILPAMKTAQLLEKIMNAVGEGIYRAGNKKYFIICGTADRPWGGIHIRNLLSQIKDASEKNWSTIPVPAGFDLKEAGGNVFEAQNAINYFLRVIAGIMHVNPSVLGLDTREARNVTEYPYFPHNRLKEELLNQIRTQLIRLHMWTKYGEKKQKQGGFSEPQWIPRIRAKTEDLLNPADRLKLDIDILNSANPVLPQTKLEVERDIIKTRGWEVILPDQETFMADLKKEQDAQQKLVDAQRKAQLEQLKNPQNPIQTPDQPEKKGMGPPEPPSKEKQQKRQDSGVNKPKVGAKKTPDRGNTRKPAEAKKAIQESLIGETIPEATQLGDSFVIANPFSDAQITIEVIELSGKQGVIARYNEDLSTIYIDVSVPIEFYKPIIAHEILQWVLEFDCGISFATAEVMATKLEDKIVKDLEMDPEDYHKRCKELETEIQKRTGVEDPDDIVEHTDIPVSESKTEPVEQKPQKVDVNINIKAEKPEKQEIEIKTQPLEIKTQKQEVEVTVKEEKDEETAKLKKENEKKKKEILEKMDKKIEEEDKE